MSDQSGATVAETTAVAETSAVSEVDNEAVLKKAVRAFVKYPSAGNYAVVISAMDNVTAEYLATFMGSK